MDQPPKPHISSDAETPGEQTVVGDDLERFVYDNPELERLEAILDDFNPFVAVRWAKQELRHSAFLRWLLDPNETHGLGSYFLASFWKRIARRSAGFGLDGPSVVDVDSWDMSAASVQVEWHAIDILAQDDVNRFVGVIENKIDAGEHDEQLARYRRDVELHFPGYRRLFAYLTPGGDAPSDGSYVPVAYREIVALIDDMLKRRGDQLASDVRRFLEHYLEMIRRHIVEDSEVQQLCRTIYEKHRKALDVLFEFRPDRLLDIRNILVDLIRQRPSLDLDHSTKAYIRFVPQELDFLPRAGEGWTLSKRLLLIQIDNYGDKASLLLYLGPGDATLRSEVHQVIAQHPKIFNRAKQKLYAKWWCFHKEELLSTKQYTELELEDIREELGRKLDHLVQDTLPPMVVALEELRNLRRHQ